MKKTVLTALAALMIGAPAAAFDGVYGETCVPDGDIVPMTIQGDMILFYESHCRMTNPVNVRDMGGAVLFDLQCEGEGETWVDRVMLQPRGDGGLIYVGRGFAAMLPRCE